MVSVGEAARMKGVHPQSIREAIREGRLKGYKSGKFYLVDAESLATYQPVGNKPGTRKTPSE